MRKAVIGVAVVVFSLVAVFAASATTTATTKLEATLNGKAEGAPKTNRGKVEVRLNAAIGKVCWDFTLAKIDGKPTRPTSTRARPASPATWSSRSARPTSARVHKRGRVAREGDPQEPRLYA